MARRLFDSYVVLVFTTLAATACDQVAAALSAAWLMFALGCGAHAGWRGWRGRWVVQAAWAAQAPGWVLAGASLALAAQDGGNEWCNGVFQLWVHPFSTWLRMVPPGVWHGFSSSYLAACLIPPGVGAWLLCGWAGGVMTRGMVNHAVRVQRADPPRSRGLPWQVSKILPHAASRMRLSLRRTKN
ncbi:hypothetical protein GCM10010885_04510 [Alicyclobacillus cellulosilyticus]|uniref:Uncharacterized protein n=1 Tax=Alicyclobacillus cellulosilyticus TaxID=1003997 RepID=A0A917K2W5_9BACL|nr:hypothetical protein [Alicyclobacillus cellulosilyticus]GGI97983.1 hypothetical protein GCM10010885_04510 [Alicyclobacillus cellulosilyticus]